MILLIGDSICGGFGQRDKKSFVHYAAEHLGISIWDESASGMSTDDYLKYLHTGIPICPEQAPPLENLEKVDLVVLSLANVDGKMSFKQRNAWSILIPRRYRLEKIDPRPYYSRRRWKRVLEKLDNFLRHYSRFAAFATGNLEVNVSPQQSKHNIEKILNRFANKKVVLISTSVTNAFYFPGAQSHYDATDNFLKGLISKRIRFFDMKTNIAPDELLDDRFHLNEKGHKRLCAEFIDAIKEHLLK
ncbi:hypothetical protein E8E95_17265 [Pseudomonas sp. BN414]|uniref:SGNH/GDSL hydrolase family protein n=1 Tax=Pseudomonas sp. BN414 TaxID=2567888 RepID=UPI002458FC03|nr:hypothetical protein [Pseudomonas sp. BN414]MDH4568434.1 hypothetical protein [Pseudomonas sp. BN414]